MSQCLNVPSGRLPIRYLGLPLSTTYPKAKSFLPLVNSCWKTLEWLASKNLSIAGRAELIRTVIHNIVSCIGTYPSNYQRPSHTLLKGFACISFGKNKLQVWSWTSICRPWMEGGLGIRRLTDVNKATCIHLLWRMCQLDFLWANFMQITYLRSNPLFLAPVSLLDFDIWKFINSTRVALAPFVDVIHDSFRILWKPTSVFSFSATWYIIRLPSSVVPYLSIIRFPHCCPKMFVYLLRALTSCLLLTIWWNDKC